ncbi:MAG: hypothetical protein ABIS39_00960 [Sphingomicrobium sp.]
MTKYIKIIADKLVRLPCASTGTTRPAEGPKYDAVAYAAALEVLG